jgi:ketosteroid isomerase-like protein
MTAAPSIPQCQGEVPPDDQQAIGKTLLTPPETSFRVLTPEVVLVSAHLRIKGQGVVGGGTLDRDNFSLRALQRQVDGSWLIVSEMFQDANTETTYAQ